MNITVQISEKDYEMLMGSNDGRRTRGSLELTSPKRGNFRCYKTAPEAAGHKYIRLSHGRVSVNERRVRMSLLVDLKESVIPGDVIWDDCWNAKQFVDKHFEK